MGAGRLLMVTWLRYKRIFYLLQRNSSKSFDVTAKQVAMLQGVLANGMDLTVLQFVGNAKDRVVPML